MYLCLRLKFQPHFATFSGVNRRTLNWSKMLLNHKFLLPIPADDDGEFFQKLQQNFMREN